ncbi:ribonuclease H-like domain-containing protein [Mycena amicta]|nr:ribonuclease H-like domain-containing protein [Mycena amicta]
MSAPTKLVSSTSLSDFGSAVVATKPPLPTIRYSWKTYPAIKQLYITDADSAECAISTFSGPCGIDIEWRPTYVKGQPENPVALLQLANADTILLLHLCHMKSIPTNLRTFLEDPDIVKAGVGIQGDVKKLYRDVGVSLCGCVDLSLLARSVDNSRWKGKFSEPIGLARLIATYEDLLLFKGKVTRSNWEKPLDPEQLEYASNDCYAGYTLFAKLSPMILSLPKMPHPRCYTFDSIRGSLVVPTSGTPWTPSNPDYDPGPPPPPREPKKPKKERKPKTDVDPAAPSTSEGKRAQPHGAQRRLSGAPQSLQTAIPSAISAGNRAARPRPRRNRRPHSAPKES